MRIKSILVITVFTILFLLGEWLVGIFQTTTESEERLAQGITDWDLILRGIGFVILVGSGAGFLTYIIRYLPHELSVQPDISSRTKNIGKGSYIFGFILFTLPVLMVIGFFALTNEPGPGMTYEESVRSFVVICVVFIGLAVFSAIFLWNYGERKRLLLAERQSQEIEVVSPKTNP